MTRRPGIDAARAGSPSTGEWINLGHVSGVFGVKGWLKVHAHTRPREGILDYRTWHLGRDTGEDARQLLAGRRQGQGVIAHLSGCDDRDAAELLVGRGIFVPADDLPAAGPGEVYWRDLVGLAVENLDGDVLGRVDGIMETGANDVLVVKGDRQRLVPFVREVIREVDLEQGRLRVDWERDF